MLLEISEIFAARLKLVKMKNLAKLHGLLYPCVFG